MKIKKVNISDLVVNPNNPRFITDDKFEMLVKSIKDFPEMLEIRPIVVNKSMVILGGNMRYKACKEAGITEVPIIVAENLTEEQEKEFLIKDNVSGGEWDFDVLNQEWDSQSLKDWGVKSFDFDGAFSPELTPDTVYSDITKEEIQKEAEKLAGQMIKNRPKVECICPECGTEFTIDE